MKRDRLVHTPLTPEQHAQCYIARYRVPACREQSIPTIIERLPAYVEDREAVARIIKSLIGETE